ncbi:hypothetical protein HMPREF7215_0980 [Pyramidobacter piscolens W5455]|uniref:Uncharacterized protein n=1 Tax=Pyramidobacter piscolens W5455 TaxID=352165 RepID=A0ABM9ZRS4_9BACT|nr:hypothetical protein [uncultured Pyramidobacter sp.]EFB89604.1 hypothetical protein HMPREF7215_0980 [Pyramidobacter piscolens W5455]
MVGDSFLEMMGGKRLNKCLFVDEIVSPRRDPVNLLFARARETAGKFRGTLFSGGFLW